MAENLQHPMSQYTQENAPKFIALIMWKLRWALPQLTVEITNEDIASFSQALDRVGGEFSHIQVRGKPNSLEIRMVDPVTAQKMVDEEAANPGAAEAMGKMMRLRAEALTVAERLLVATYPDIADVKRAAIILKELGRQ